MAEKIKLEIVTPDAMVISQDVDEVTATGSEGEFGVLPGHCHMLSTLKEGSLSYKDGNNTGSFELGGGYAEVGPNKVTILADSAEKSDEIDIERAKEAMKRAEELLKQAADIDEARATAAVERAAARIHLGGM